MDNNLSLSNSATVGSYFESAHSDTAVEVNPETYAQYSWSFLFTCCTADLISKLLVYYRLFTNSIGITSRQPAHVDNPYLGRVARNSISPPQAALHFKRRLCSVENIRGFPSFSLYLSASNKSPMDDGDRIPALKSTIDNPMELVVEIPYREMTKRTDKAYPHAQYSTRPTSISRYLLILFQFIIASTRKMASLSRKRLSKLILITPRLLHASTRI
jgi:hypothetical protein